MSEIIPFDMRETGKILKDKFFNGQFRGKPVQSVCWAPNIGSYLVGFSHNADPQRGTIIRTTGLSFEDSSVLSVRTDLPVCHCNDMEYNPADGMVYIAQGTKQIAVINPHTMLAGRTIPVDCYAWAISRYRDGSWFIHDGHGGRKYDPSFHLISFETDETEKLAAALGVPYDPVKQCYRGYWQGSVMIDNRPYMIYTEWSDKPDVFTSCCLVTFRRGDPEIYRFETPYEVEGACMKDGQLQFVFGNIFIGGFQWEMSEMKMKTVYGTIKNVGIPSDTNVKVDFSKYVPEGYELVSVNVNCKVEKLWRSLPTVRDGKIVAYVLKVAEDNVIVLRSSEAIAPTSLKVIGFCRKIS